MASGQLIFQPPMFDWPSDNQQTVFKEWQSHHTHVGSLHHSPRKMVCQHRRFPGHQRLQAMATPRNIQEGQGEEASWKCVQGLRGHFRTHQTGWTRNHQSTRPMHQDFSQEVQLHIREWEEATLIRATLPCHQTLRSQEVGQITYSTRRKSPSTNYYNMPNNMRQPLRTSTDRSPMEELQWQPQ